MKLKCWRGFDHSYQAFHSPAVTASPQTNPSLLICTYRTLETSLETSLGPCQPPLNSSHPQVSSFLPLRAITKNHPNQSPTFLCLSQLPSAHSCSSQGFPPLLEPQISAKKAVPCGSSSTFCVTYLARHLEDRSREDFCSCGMVKKIPASGPLRA